MKPEQNNQQLQALVERLSLQFFGEPFRHQVKFNPRLRTTGGRVVFPSIGRRVQEDQIYMEINPKFVQQNDRAMLEGVIKHELAHYHLYFRKGLHREDDPDFQRALRKLHAPKKSPLKPNYHQELIYECIGPAHHRLVRHKRVDTNRYVCAQCRAPLRLISEKHM